MRTNPEQQFPRSLLIVASLALALSARSAPPEPQVIFPPSLPGGQAVMTNTSAEFLKRPPTLHADVTVAKTAPTIDFLFASLAACSIRNGCFSTAAPRQARARTARGSSSLPSHIDRCRPDRPLSILYARRAWRQRTRWFARGAIRGEDAAQKVIAFLHSFYAAKAGCTLKGTFSSAVDPAGDNLYISWNNSRGSKAWDSCVLTVVHLPASERQ